MTERAPIRAGDLLVLVEEDYQYGIGELVIVVLGIHNLRDPAWVAVDGTEIGWNGAALQPRSIRVIRSALVDAKRKGDAKRGGLASPE
jgi:hypothetical protein